MVQQRKEGRDEELNQAQVIYQERSNESESCSGEEEETIPPVQIDLASLSHENSERFEQANGDQGRVSAVPEEEYSAKLAEKVLQQAMQLQHQEEQIEALKRKLGKEASGPSTDLKRASKDKKMAQQTIAKLTERVLKAEKREAESSKRANSATQAMKSRERELKTLRMRSERFDKESRKIEKSNQLMRTYIGRLECRLASAVNTKSDVQKLQHMGEKLSSVKKENESLQTKLSDIMEENILLCESLKEVRSMIDKQALSLGLESGEVLVELSQQRQVCSLLEQKVEATEKDNQLLIDYIKDLRSSASDCQDANVVLDKLSNPNIIKIEKAQDSQQEDKDAILENRLDSVKEEIARLGETVRAQEERERTLIKNSNEERNQLKSLMRELGESQAQSDALSLENQSLKKKYQHLKSVFKSLQAFCGEASQMKDLQDIGEVEIEKLDEIERQIINLSTNIIGPENRSFIKLYMSVLGNCLEQRRGNINLREESEILRETVKELSTKIARIGSEKAAIEKELSKQQVVSEIHSHTKSITGENSMHDPYNTPPVESPPFRFQTKSFADSYQTGSTNKDPQSVRSDETSRKIDELERELHLVKTIAKRSRDLQIHNEDENGKGEEDTPTPEKSVIGFGSVSKMDSENSGMTDYMSPMSNSGFDSPSPIVDWGRYSKFTPGKYSMKERMQLLQNRFATLEQEVEKAEVNGVSN